MFAVNRSVICSLALLLLAGSSAAQSQPAAAGSEGPDDSSLLQRPSVSGSEPEAKPEAGASAPHVIGLRRESVPIYRRGKIASFKTSYSGILSVGTPAQEFRVVFDTGSGHIVLPAAECKSEACLVHRRFNMSESHTAVPINSDGGIVPEGQLADQVTIGFGTGEITGEFARDKVCWSSPHEAAPPEDAEASGVVIADAEKEQETVEADLCVEMSVILAVEMSTQPFKTFQFDGILGLGLDGLALNKNFSAFDMLFGSGQISASHFGVFLTEGEDGEESEIAMGGMNDKRLLDPISWAPVAMPDLGYWQVNIVAVRINGVELDVCKDGTCRGVVDTGTSHLGIPAPFDGHFAEQLTRPAGDLLDCRLVEAPEVEIQLAERNLTLHPFNYMRRLPLREGVSVSSQQGVYVPSNETNATLGKPSAADAVGSPKPPAADGNVTAAASNTSAQAVATASNGTEAEAEVQRFCRPRLMPVRLPEPLGPKLFILGEPVLHRYYTVFDWGAKRVGFSLANNRRNTMDPEHFRNQRGELPKEVDMLLMQKTIGVTAQGGSRRGTALPSGHGGEEIQEEAILVQVQVRLSVSMRPRFPRTEAI